MDKDKHRKRKGEKEKETCRKRGKSNQGREKVGQKTDR